jgi:cell wall-associated NlpC family hydrolase
MRAGHDYRLFHLLMAVLVMSVVGCASEPAYPPRSSGPSTGIALPQHPGASIAASQVGAPYRYGGSSPRGFDCSGLVYYSYRKAGIRVPRTTNSQLNNAHRVPLKQLQPGDLLFFKLDRRPVSHVGIYAGNDRFIHAPSRGKKVSFTSMNDPYWRQRLVSAGRY